MVFVHNPWMLAEGNAAELRKAADSLDVHAEAIKDIYMQRTDMSADELQDMMDDDIRMMYFTRCGTFDTK